MVKVKMGMSATGRNSAVSVGRGFAGFTLFEMIIVLFIVSLFLSLVRVPIEGMLAGGDLGRGTRMIMSEVTRLRGEAAYARKPQALVLNMTEHSFYPLEPEEDRKLDGSLSETEKRISDKQMLPQGVYFEDVVVLSRGKDQEGEAYIRFYANGCVDHSLIHLKNSANHTYTLEINPITGYVRIHDGYIEKKKER
ncbi:MAG: prepilin-type N-terminal cleavage/methylation domain-containing protein [Deltaproteobacteria bacterium]|nr:prepilin-type N-terminal cleavage/methylation domain-containing protein [Deltaproteobacteria bacterium]